MMRYLVLLAVLVAGCGLDPKYREAKDAERIEQAQKACEKLGYQAGTAEWRDCAKDIFSESNKKPTVVSGGSKATSTRCTSYGNQVQCNSF